MRTVRQLHRQRVPGLHGLRVWGRPGLPLRGADTRAQADAATDDPCADDAVLPAYCLLFGLAVHACWLWLVRALRPRGPALPGPAAVLPTARPLLFGLAVHACGLWLVRALRRRGPVLPDPGQQAAVAAPTITPRYSALCLS